MPHHLAGVRNADVHGNQTEFHRTSSCRCRRSLIDCPVRRAAVSIGAAKSIRLGARMIDVLLFEPEIPPNTGNVMRLCANTGARLHLIAPLGFDAGRREVAARGTRLRRLGRRHGARQSRGGIARARARARARVHDAREPPTTADVRYSNVATRCCSVRRRAAYPTPCWIAIPADDRLRIPMRPNSTQPEPLERGRGGGL